jgi:beta-N-acetylhexosaminidase
VLAASVAAATLLAAGCASDRPAATAPATSRPATSAPAPPASPACSQARVLGTWSTRRLAAQTVVVPVQETDVGTAAAEVAGGAGGIILFGNEAPVNLGSSVAQLARGAQGHVAPLVMTDEEGGAVQRMANLVGSIPSARDMAATLTPPQIEQLALQAGRRMKAAGVSMDLAPVLDLDDGPGPSATDPDGTRSFSLDQKVATADGLAFAAGLAAAGVIPVVKHFPGLGQATANTDVQPASTLPWSQLQSNGLLPFRAAVRARVPAIMISNASVPGLTTLPASISPTVITRVLRQQLGFSGLVLTDSLSAGALSSPGYSVPAASVAALAAGADMVLYNADPGSAAPVMTQIVQAVRAGVRAGKLSRSRLQDAVAHILAVKHVNLCG